MSELNPKFIKKAKVEHGKRVALGNFETHIGVSKTRETNYQHLNEGKLLKFSINDALDDEDLESAKKMLDRQRKNKNRFIYDYNGEQWARLASLYVKQGKIDEAEKLSESFKSFKSYTFTKMAIEAYKINRRDLVRKYLEAAKFFLSNIKTEGDKKGDQVKKGERKSAHGITDRTNLFLACYKCEVISYEELQRYLDTLPVKGIRVNAETRLAKDAILNSTDESQCRILVQNSLNKIAMSEAYIYNRLNSVKEIKEEWVKKNGEKSFPAFNLEFLFKNFMVVRSTKKIDYGFSNPNFYF